jgi:hypothetical protein
MERTEAVLVTNDYDAMLELGGRRVRCVPAAWFLLFDRSLYRSL